MSVCSVPPARTGKFRSYRLAPRTEWHRLPGHETGRFRYSGAGSLHDRLVRRSRRPWSLDFPIPCDKQNHDHHGHVHSAADKATVVSEDASSSVKHARWNGAKLSPPCFDSLLWSRRGSCSVIPLRSQILQQMFKAVTHLHLAAKVCDTQTPPTASMRFDIDAAP